MALLVPGAARSLEPAQRELLLRSLRSGHQEQLERQLGGLESLPLVAAELRLDGDARTLEGSVQIDWPNRSSRSLSHLKLRLHHKRPQGAGSASSSWSDFHSVKASVDGAEFVPVELEDLPGEYLRISLPKKLAPAKRVILRGELRGKLRELSSSQLDPMTAFDFLSPLPTSPRSRSSRPGITTSQLEKSDYGMLDCGAGICTVVGALPEIPALVDGKFDTVPNSGIGDAAWADAVNLILSVVLDASWSTSATGVQVGRTPVEGGRQRLTFAMAGAREVGFVASPHFVMDEIEVQGVRLQSLSRIQHQAAGRRVLEVARQSLITFEQSFGTYPWSSLVLAESALTGGAAGMELPGLALVATAFYGPPPPQLRAANPSGQLWRETLDFIVRHEVAHEWWHAQVGSHPQLHPYVDEPLAQWSALYATEKSSGKEAAKRAFENQVAMNFRAMSLLGNSDGTVARQASDFASKMEYVGLVYGKAPVFYERLRELIGTEALIEALNGIVHDHRFRSLSPAELKAALVKAGGKKGAEVAILWQRWFHEEHGEEDLGSLKLSSLIQQVDGLEALPPELLEQLENLDPAMLLEPLKELQKLLGLDLNLDHLLQE